MPPNRTVRLVRKISGRGRFDTHLCVSRFYQFGPHKSISRVINIELKSHSVPNYCYLRLDRISHNVNHFFLWPVLNNDCNPLYISFSNYNVDSLELRCLCADLNLLHKIILGTGTVSYTHLTLPTILRV